MSADEELVDALIAAMFDTGGPRLRVDGTLACGGVGSIHTAFDRVLQRRLAKKTLLAAARDNPSLVRSFRREASITAQLDHPNIVPSTTSGSTSTPLYAVAEWDATLASTHHTRTRAITAA